jgi:hypothetical protein
VADPVAAQGHEEGARVRPREARARDEAAPGEVYAEEDAEEPRGERAQEAAQVEKRAIAHRQDAPQITCAVDARCSRRASAAREE